MPSGRRGRVAQGTPVLEAARQLGVEIESICGGHLTCNKCRVRVENGRFSKHGITSNDSHLSSIRQEERLALDRLNSPECRLSCTARVEDDVLIYVPEESRGQKQIIRNLLQSEPLPSTQRFANITSRLTRLNWVNIAEIGGGCRMHWQPNGA